jgi:MFS transporter, ACS family, tartrate transporter
LDNLAVGSVLRYRHIVSSSLFDYPNRREVSMVASPADAANPIEAGTIRKLRWRIIPFVFVLFVIAFVDRINIGFAALTMNKELAISSQQFGFVAGIFFFGYFVFEVPSNLLLHKIGARIWIARILISWGVVAILTGFAKTAMHLYVLRFLLGVAEAGYIPGILLYLTYWFTQGRLGHAMALFCAANPFASVVGAPISGLILDRIHWLGLSSWRWLLILEGLPAIVGGILTYFLLPGRPAEATFLTAQEKRCITGELEREKRQKLTTSQITVGQALMHARVWHLTAAYFMALVSMYAMTFWMPQLVKGLSSQYSNTTVGILVMIPYLAAMPAMILVSRSSDRTLERRYHIAIPEIVGVIALLLLGAVTTHSAFFTVVLWCFVAMGIYCLLGPFWALPNEFLTGFSAAAGIALVNSIGNLGGFVGPYAMGAISRRTGSFHGGLVFAGVSLFASAMLILFLPKQNRTRAGI